MIGVIKSVHKNTGLIDLGGILVPFNNSNVKKNDKVTFDLIVKKDLNTKYFALNVVKI